MNVNVVNVFKWIAYKTFKIIDTLVIPEHHVLVGDSGSSGFRPHFAMLDFMKGCAILLVILGHSIQTSVVKFDDNFIFRIIYSFHMPLFMLLSGFTIQLPLKINILKKMRRLFIPFLSFGLISYYAGLIDINFFMIFFKPDYGLWFLYVLFLINLWLFCFYKSYVFNKYAGVLVSIILYFTFSYITEIFSYYLPYVLLGIFLRHLVTSGYIRSKNYNLYSNLMLIVLSLLFIFLVYFWHRIDVPVFLTSQYTITIYRFLTAICGISIFYLVVSTIYRLLPLKLIIILGINSLELYALHPYVLKIFPFTPYYPIKFIIVSCVTYILIELLRYNRYLQLFLFGSLPSASL